MTRPSSDARVLDTASFTLTVSGDARFLAMVRALAARTAETVGVTTNDAARLADALSVVMDLVVQAGKPRATPDIMDVRFDVEPDALHVVIAYEAPKGARAGWTFERELAAHGRLEAFRSLAPDAEFGMSGSHLMCRLTCAHSRRS
jgi:hypothetical protein